MFHRPLARRKSPGEPFTECSRGTVSEETIFAHQLTRVCKTWHMPHLTCAIATPFNAVSSSKLKFFATSAAILCLP